MTNGYIIRQHFFSEFHICSLSSVHVLVDNRSKHFWSAKRVGVFTLLSHNSIEVLHKLAAVQSECRAEAGKIFEYYENKINGGLTLCYLRLRAAGFYFIRNFEEVGCLATFKSSL